jgi:hypothetical protein
MNRVYLNLGLLLYSEGDRVGATEHPRKTAEDPNLAISAAAQQVLERVNAQRSVSTPVL